MQQQTQREESSTQDFTFPRELRLRRPSEFRTVFQDGSKAVGGAFVCHVTRSEGVGAKLGLAVSRKVGNAAVRNRVKRHIREFFRVRRTGFKCEAQVVVVARPQARHLSAAEAAQALESLLKSKGVL